MGPYTTQCEALKSSKANQVTAPNAGIARRFHSDRPWPGVGDWSLGAMTPRGARLVGLILAIALGQFLSLRVRSAWTNYWLLRDAQKGTAVVTKELWSGHNAVGYKYALAIPLLQSDH